jgi:hypothetical protein
VCEEDKRAKEGEGWLSGQRERMIIIHGTGPNHVLSQDINLHTTSQEDRTHLMRGGGGGGREGA